MWDITAETKALALAPVRHIWCRAIFGARSGNTWTNDRNYYGTDKIVSAVVDIGTKSGGIQVGNAFCGKLTLLLLDGVEIHQSDRIIMRVGFYKADGSRSEEISLGWYYVDTVKKSNGIYTVTAYDKMLRAHKNYNSKLTYPAKMSAVLLELCDLLDVNLASDFAIPYDGTISEKPAKGTDSDGNTIYYTRREMLSYLASAMGGNFFFDAGGHLQLTRFATVEDSFAAANSIEADISDDSYSVNGIVWTLGGVTYSRNDEDTNGIMEFENPLTFYPKEPVQHAIEERVTGLNYHEATIKRQGCGWFELGDIVAAYRADGTSAPILVTGLSYSIADGGFTEKIYSSARSSSQDNYTTGDIIGQSVPQSVGGTVQNPSGTGSALTEYKYLTDTSVKFNGTTYTVEKDAETGLISKISDSAGNEFEPEISAGITDVAMHNAVFWAVAMCRGISKTAFIMDGIFGMFTPDTRDIANLRWKNSVTGYNDIILSGASENGEAVHFTASQYGTFACAEPSTVYAIVKSEVSKVVNCIITKRLSQLSNSEHYGFGLLQFDGNLYFSSAAYDIQQTNVSCIEYHVYCFTRVDGVTYFYIDGALVGHVGNCMTGKYANMMYLNNEYLGSTRLDAPTICDFVMCAFGSQYHDEATVRNNSAYLMKKYKIGGNT